MIEVIEILLFFVLAATLLSFVVLGVIGAAIKLQNGQSRFFYQLRGFKLGMPSLVGTLFGAILLVLLISLENKLARSEIRDSWREAT